MEDQKQRGNIGVALLVVVLVGAAFMIGRLSSQVELLKKGSTASPTTAGTTPAPSAAPDTVLSVENLKKYAKDLGLKTDEFNKCLDEGKTAQKIKDDTAAGSALGVSGTPSFFIDDVMVVGAYPQTMFESIVDFILAGGNWKKPTATVKDLVDKDEKNGEVTLGNKVETGKGYVTGPADAKVKMVIFSDFECPYCTRAYPTIKALESKYADKMSFEFRNFPLPFHASAQKAAEAAACAGEQGKFWEMHDKLFGIQQQQQ